MQTPLRVTFRHMQPSLAAEAYVREHAERLERFHDRITSCLVVIDAPPAHRAKGAPFDVRISVTVPGAEICASSEPSDQAAHGDLYVALHGAFDAAKRMLQDHVRESRGDIKHHAQAEQQT